MLWVLTGIYVNAVETKSETSPVVRGPYMGQKPPGMIPEVFAPGIVSVKDRSELNSVFSPKGDEFFFTVFNEAENWAYMMYSIQVNRVWTKPEIAPMSNSLKKYNDVDMAYSPNGNRLYFCSNRPVPWNPKPELNIWYCTRKGNGWSQPVYLEKPVNSEGLDLYPTFVADGTMYFASSRKGSLGSRDVYYSKWKDGAFTAPVRMGSAINTKYLEGDTYISPDEDYLIVTSDKRPDGLGSADLYISFRKKDGTWAPAKNMGKPINTDGVEFCPMVSPDGKYFFFTRKDRVSKKGNIYWVDAKIIESLRLKEK